MRTSADSQDSASQFLIIEMAVKADQYDVGILSIYGCDLEVMFLNQVKQGLFTDYVDRATGKAVFDILDSGLTCAQHVRRIGLDTQAS